MHSHLETAPCMKQGSNRCTFFFVLLLTLCWFYMTRVFAFYLTSRMHFSSFSFVYSITSRKGVFPCSLWAILEDAILPFIPTSLFQLLEDAILPFIPGSFIWRKGSLEFAWGLLSPITVVAQTCWKYTWFACWGTSHVPSEFLFRVLRTLVCTFFCHMCFKFLSCLLWYFRYLWSPSPCLNNSHYDT